jgi:2-C-methyl-D-erythritol 2,4-cyclodiphosphate synthase
MPAHPDNYHDAMPDSQPAVRIGHGYDLHRLEPLPPKGRGKPFVLAGIRVEHPLGPVGHSDGDALLHAVTDALLGALSLPDIGQLFPDTDPQWQDVASRVFLEEAAARVHEAGFALANLDCTVPLKDRLRGALADALSAPLERVNVKGKTHENLPDRADKAIEVHAVALLERRRTP